MDSKKLYSNLMVQKYQVWNVCSLIENKGYFCQKMCMPSKNGWKETDHVFPLEHLTNHRGGKRPTQKQLLSFPSLVNHLSPPLRSPSPCYPFFLNSTMRVRSSNIKSATAVRFVNVTSSQWVHFFSLSLLLVYPSLFHFFKRILFISSLCVSFFQFVLQLVGSFNPFVCPSNFVFVCVNARCPLVLILWVSLSLECVSRSCRFRMFDVLLSLFVFYRFCLFVIRCVVTFC